MEKIPSSHVKLPTIDNQFLSNRENFIYIRNIFKLDYRKIKPEIFTIYFFTCLSNHATTENKRISIYVSISRFVKFQLKNIISNLPYRHSKPIRYTDLDIYIYIFLNVKKVKIYTHC